MDQNVEYLRKKLDTIQLKSSRSRDVYSLRVFFGGLPSDFVEDDFKHNFKGYKIRQIDWPSKLDGYKPRGFVFVDFEDQFNVKKFIRMTFVDDSKKRKVLMKFSKNRTIFVEIKPFYIKDAKCGYELHPKNAILRQVFVGGLPREAKAYEVKNAFQVFGDVTEVMIDLNMITLYPRGSAIVTFANLNGCRNALLTRVYNFVHHGGIRNIEIKPMIPSNMFCPLCCSRLCTDFCTHPNCLQISCNMCWHLNHCAYGFNHEKYRSYRGAYYTNRNIINSFSSINSLGSY